ncbi:MAG: right-handed parallel beta-helix repeat-containing protein [Planctomycetota bacterium]
MTARACVAVLSTCCALAGAASAQSSIGSIVYGEDKHLVIDAGVGVQGALDIVARLRGEGVAGDVTLRLSDGVHALPRTLVLRPESCSATGSLVIESEPGARAVLSGGRSIAFTPDTWNGHTVWVAELGSAGKDVRELWIDGERRTLARHPDRGTFAVGAVPTADADWTHGNFGFRFEEGQLDERAVGADVVVMSRWVESHLPVSAVDAKAATFTSSKRSVFRLEPGDPWYAEGALAFLDQPGEFCVDRNTGRLIYLPRPGEQSPRVAVVPQLAQLLRIEGAPEKGRLVQNVTFRGLSFEHAEWWFPPDFVSNWPAPDAGGFSQAAILVPAAIEATFARNCRFEDCEIAHVGGYALRLGRGCVDDALVRCRVHDLGAGGIEIGEAAIPKNDGDRVSGNSLVDCEIGDGGHLFHSAVGVWIGQSPGNLIEHCEIHDFLYTGISVGWTWGYGDAAARDERVIGNHVHHIGVRQDGEGPWLSDMAGIYTLGRQPGTLIEGNWFHDIAAVKYGGWGIYFDEGTSEVRALRNVVARTTHGGFHQHYGKDNVFLNNVLIAGRDAQIQRTRQEPHTSFSFRRNIVFWPTGELFAGDLRDLHFDFADDLYWRTDGREIRFLSWTLAEWQEHGMDRDSRIADPHFVDAAHDDYRLADDSPARALGIESVDVRDAGPRPPRGR